MSDLFRSSWGVMLAHAGHPVIGMIVLAATAVAVVAILVSARLSRASWQREDGLTLLETIVVLLLAAVVVLAVFVLT